MKRIYHKLYRILSPNLCFAHHFFLRDTRVKWMVGRDLNSCSIVPRFLLGDGFARKLIE
ncbi:MAG: hypothetical protein AAF349_14445 [Cyanobacteria bacterium P01_A01_bin.68]